MLLHQVIDLLDDNQSVVICNSENNEQWYGTKETYFEQEKLYYWWYKVERMYSTDEDSMYLHIISEDKILEDIKKRKIEEFKHLMYDYIQEFDKLDFGIEEKNNILNKNINYIKQHIK